MSYILDALRKADAQRLRDPGRGIHTQAAAPAPDVGRSRRPALAIAVSGVAATLLLVLGVWMWGGGEPAAPALPSRQAEVLAIAVAPAANRSAPADAIRPPAAPAIVAPPVPVRSEAAPVVSRPDERSARAVMPAVPVVAAPAVTPAAGPAAAIATVPAVGQSTGVPASAPSATAASSTPADRIYALAELPPDVQQALPKLAVSGGVFSRNVAQRMLVVNAQVFNEGSEVAPGVVLERVRERDAVLRFRGLRIAQPY